MRGIALVLACTASLAACGGGGGGGSGGSPSPPPAPGPVNGAPTMSAQSFNGTEDTVLTSTLVAADPGDTLTFTVATNPTHGTLSITSAGAFTYTPNANFNGADTFTATVTDSASHSVNAIMTLNLAAVNDAPTASNDVLAVTSADALNVLANDSDPDNDALTMTITGTPFVGTATVNADRTVKLALPAGFKGFSKFSYRITDAASVTADATALVFVGIEPFKVVTLSPASTPGGPSGIFVNDLFTSRLVTEASLDYAHFVTDGMIVDQGGRAAAFKYNGPNGMELRYVDLDHPGTSRLVHGPLSGSQAFGRVGLTHNGRFVVYEYQPNGAPPGQMQQLYVFDRDGSGPGQRLSLPEADQPLARFGAFNPTGTAMYYAGMNATNTPWTCAVFRADFATRTVTQVSIASLDTPAFFWPLPDDSGYVDIRFYAAGGMDAYITRNATPTLATRLSENRIGPNVYFPAAMSRDGRYFVYTEESVSFGPLRLALTDTGNPGSSVTVGGGGFGSPEITDYYGMRSDSQAMMVSRNDYTGASLSGIYEVPLATASTATPVLLGTNTSTRFDSVYYSTDGARITYSRADYTTSDYSVAVTRRGAFGQTARLSPIGQNTSGYEPDSSGYVLLIGLQGSGSPDTAMLVNVDAPDSSMPMGQTATGPYRGFNLVAR